MEYVKVWDPFERFLWGVAITLIFVCSLFYIIKGKKREILNEKIMLIGFGCYFMGLTFQRLFGAYLGHIFISGFYNYSNFTYMGNFGNIEPLFEVFFKLSYIFWAVGAALFIFAFEISIKRTKYLLTIIQIPFLSFLIILPYDLARSIHHYILYPYSSTVILLIIVLLAKWSRFELKALSSILFSGVVFIMVSSILVSKDVKILNIVPLFISPMFYLIGAFIILLPLIINPKALSHGLIFWIIIGISSLIVLFYLEFFIIFTGSDIFQFFLYLLAIFVVLFLEYQIITDVKLNKLQDKKEEETSILEMFTKPKTLIEEEISISKEKKICLVCKNKISGINYICSECGTFYCLKCSEALSNLENVCWACNYPINKSKASKPYEIREEMSEQDSDKQNSKPNLKPI